MIHKAWSSIEEMPYCFWWSSVKFLGHTAQKSVDFDPNWAFPDCNSNLNSPMGMKWLHKAWSGIEEVPYCFFQVHPSNFKVAQLWKSSNLTPIGRFRSVTQIWIHQWVWNDTQNLKPHKEVPYCFARSSVKLQGYTGQKIADFDPN